MSETILQSFDLSLQPHRNHSLDKTSGTDKSLSGSLMSPPSCDSLDTLPWSPHEEPCFPSESQLCHLLVSLEPELGGDSCAKALVEGVTLEECNRAGRR